MRREALTSAGKESEASHSKAIHRYDLYYSLVMTALVVLFLVACTSASVKVELFD